VLTCYEQATEALHLARLAVYREAMAAHPPFFRLPGRIQWGHDAVHIDLRPFNNRQLTRDLLAVCQRANEIQPRLPGDFSFYMRPLCLLTETLFKLRTFLLI
jgi:hypothetical protein